MRFSIVFLAVLGCATIGTLPTMADDVTADADSALMEADESGDHDSESHDHEGEGHGDGEHGDDHAATPLLSFDIGSAIWNLIIFLCVLAILSTFVWPSVLGGLQAREEKIREDLEAAEKANVDAKALLASYESKLNDANSQAQAVLADARKDAESLRQRIVDEAKSEAAAQRDRALADIDNAKKVAMAEMASQTSSLAMQVARGVVGRELSPDDHADLIRDAMQNVPSQN
ncbi:MAG: F0F1 ATP synthase subunit B [Planctomycetota bacterium]